MANNNIPQWKGFQNPFKGNIQLRDILGDAPKLQNPLKGGVPASNPLSGWKGLKNPLAVNKK